MNETVKTWIYATRPHTLGASIAPMLVVLGSLIGDGHFHLGLFILCLIIALSAQIASNFANDYFDYMGEKDTGERVGFDRLLQTGTVTPRKMMIALMITLSICITAGIMLVALQGWHLIVIGLLVIVGALGYSAGPYPLSHNALGDIAVVVFYGIIPILISYYAIADHLPNYLIPIAFGMGLWEANILVTNNYRDYKEDDKNNKKTLVVKMGEKSGPILYALNGLLSILGIVLGLILRDKMTWGIVLAIVCIIFYSIGILSIRQLKGRALNKLLKYTNRVSLLIGLLICLALLV